MFYIHYADPSFGQRRHGPYLTEDEAIAQAVEDGAVGYGQALGIYSEEDSEQKMADTPIDTTPDTDIASEADTRREEINREAATVADSDRTAIESLLPAGVTLDQLADAGLMVVPVGGYPNEA